jgi:hypothetical protein
VACAFVMSAGELVALTDAAGAYGRAQRPRALPA